MKLQTIAAWTGAALAAVLVVATCLPGDPGRPVGERCDGEQCEGGLLCLYGRCRAECMTNRDCPGEALCVVGPEGDRGCTLAEEETGCTPECLEGMTCVAAECVEIAPEVGADGDADADGDDVVDPRTELIRELAGNWIGVFGMSGGPGCLCLTLDDEGNVDPGASLLVLFSDEIVQNFPFSGGGSSITDMSGPDPAVEITFVLMGDNHTFSGTFDAEADELDGDYIPSDSEPPDSGAPATFDVVLDRQGLSCADRIGAPGAGC